MRLNNYISSTGLCSRREADKLIESMGEYEKKGIMKDIAVTKAVKFVVDAAVEK